MKKLMFILLSTIFVVSVLAEDFEYYKNRVLVRLSQNVNMSLLDSDGLRTGLTNFDEVASEIKVSKIKPLYGFNDRSALAEELGMTRDYIVDYTANISEKDVIEKLSKLPEVVIAEYDVKYELDYNPTDSLVLTQWYLNKIQAKQAWDTQKGAEGITIAIVDTGLKVIHRDLRRSVWENEAEVNGINGVDDDGNGKIDDFNGWDFSDGDNSLLHDFTLPTGGEDHGTHCAGAAAATDHTDLTENTGIVGTAFDAKIMGVKIFPNSFASVTAPAIRYAADMGARVSSNSWGGAGASSLNSSAVNYSVQNGCIFVASAGNDNVSTPHYPSGYTNAMSVAATDNFDNKASFSNYGSSVTICAPGTSIWSTVDRTVATSAGLDYDNWDGTSMATPIVSGAAAICLAYAPQMFPETIDGVNLLRDFLEDYGDTPNHAQIGLRLNLVSTLEAIQGGVTLDPPENLSATVDGDDVMLDWDAPGQGGSGATELEDGFEDYSDFVLQFDPWILNDVDGGSTWGIEGYEFDNQYAPMAYIVFNPSAVTPPMNDDDEIQPHTGDKFAACFASNGVQNDDWLITPAIEVGDNFALDFFAKSYTDQYGLERMKVGISTTGTNPSDFTIISSGSQLEVPVAWTPYHFSLNAYAGETIHIGIQCISNDAFIFMVDDVVVGDGTKVVYAQDFENTTTIQSKTANREAGTFNGFIATDVTRDDPTGYNVYRDGSNIASTGAGVTEYIDAGMTSGSYSYYVTALYGSDESEPSNTVSATGIEDGAVPENLMLYQNYPNPFNPETAIKFYNNVAGNVKLTIHNIKGERVAKLIDRDLSIGMYTVNFKALGLNSGTYYYTLESQGQKITKKMLLVK